MLKSDLNRHFDALLDNHIDGVDLRYRIIDKKIMDRCGSAGLEVWCWTVNDVETAIRMRELGVTAVTTNRPAWLRENL